MKKLFIFGSHPTLSLAELRAFLGVKFGDFWHDQVFLADLPVKIDAESLINDLGGTIKIAEILGEFPSDRPDLIEEAIRSEIFSVAKQQVSKTCFGFSFYGQSTIVHNFGLKIKQELKDNNINSRLVVSQEKILSSVVVRQNKLLSRGREFIIANREGKTLVAYSEAVQDFKELSKRDYGRPARDDLSGMLPPKLARIMVNLAGPVNQEKRLFDPFCGSGTILTEAALAGYKYLVGADISSQAIYDSQENFAWTKERYNLDKIDLRFINRQVSNLTKVVKEKSIDLIVTEPYLGPQRGLNNIPIIKAELEDLYRQAFNQFSKILKDDGLIIMVWPIFFQKIFLEPNFSPFKIISPFQDLTNLPPAINLSERNTLIYGRPSQRVWREVVILAK